MNAHDLAKRILADLVAYPELLGPRCLWSIHHVKGAPVLDYSPCTVEELKALCEAIAE